MRVMGTNPGIRVVPASEIPDPLPQAERITMIGRLAAFGSAEIMEKVDEFARTVNQFFFASGTFNAVRETAGDVAEKAWKEQEKWRDKAREELRAIEDLVRDELARA